MANNRSVEILWSRRFDAGSWEQDCACANEATAPQILWTFPGDVLEDDCACPGLAFVPGTARDLSAFARWQQTPGLYCASLTGEYTLYYAPLGGGGVVVLNRAARDVLHAFSTPARVEDVLCLFPDLLPGEASEAVQQLAALALIQPAGASSVLLEADASMLTVWLHMTNACNLQCSYCYVPKDQQRMGKEIGLAALDAVFRAATRHGYQTVKLKYAGGEPLLSFALVQTLHRQAQELARQSGLGLQEVVLSNGTLLTDEMLDFFRVSGMRLMISLDGVSAAHDAQRPFANGEGSFEQIAHNIDRTLARGVSPHLSITLTGQNVEGAASAVAFALERNLLFNLNFWRPPQAELGVWEVDEVSLVEAARRAFQAIEASPPPHSLVAGLLDRASFVLPHAFPCGAGRDYLVIDPQGRVARCQMDLNRPTSDIWADDLMLAVCSVSGAFENVAVDERAACRACSWRYACAGGCPRLTRQTFGRNRAASPYCGVYRALFPELLQLEGMRLLRQMPE